MPSPTTLKLPEDLKSLLVAQAEAEGKTPHAYMVEALAEKARRVERKRQEAAEEDRELGEIERTGIAYAFEDVREYIVGIAAGRKPPRPKPIKAPRKKS
jgi:predicted transcriptional regulator